MSLIEISVTCPDETCADRIADTLLAERLIACANRQSPIESRYVWQGKVECEREVVVLLKTRESLFHKIADRIASLHPYDVPAILALPIRHVNQSYEKWVLEQTDAPEKNA